MRCARAVFISWLIVGCVSAALGSAWFPFTDAVWTYASPTGELTSTVQEPTETEPAWKQAIRDDAGKLIRANWFTERKDGIYLSRTMGFDRKGTVTIDFATPQLYLPNDFQRRKSWSGEMPNTTVLAELTLGSTPVKVRLSVTYRYQFVVGTAEKVERWTTIPVKETAVVEITGVRADTGNPDVDAMLDQLLQQSAELGVKPGGVVTLQATRWFANGVGEVRSDETGSIAGKGKETRTRRLLRFEAAK